MRLADPVDVAEEALGHLADGPTWIYGSKNPACGSPLGALSRRDAALAMSGGAPAEARRASSRRAPRVTSGRPL